VFIKSGKCTLSINMYRRFVAVDKRLMQSFDCAISILEPVRRDTAIVSIDPNLGDDIRSSVGSRRVARPTDASTIQVGFKTQRRGFDLVGLGQF